MNNNENNKDNQLITPLDNKLSPKQWKFLEYITKGLSVPEAYKLSGFKGKHPNSPYLMNHRLKDKISEILVNNGFNSNNYMVKVEELLSLPLKDDQKQVTIDQRIKIMRLFKDSLPEMKKEHTFTQFTIVNGTVPNAVDDAKPITVINVKETEEEV